MDIFPFLNLMAEKGASDLFFSVGAPVNVKIEGEAHPLTMPPLKPGEVKQIAYSVMNQKQIAEFESKLEMNLAISAERIGRFRVNVFMQRGEAGMVVRYIKSTIPPMADLGLPRDALLLALVGFNLGVEAGQLAIVACFLPVAFALRETPLYRRGIMTGGSLLIALIAFVWMLERVLDLNIITGR